MALPVNKDERLEVFYMFQYLRPGNIPRSFLYLREQRAKLAELVLSRLEEIYGSSYFMNLHAGEKHRGMVRERI